MLKDLQKIFPSIVTYAESDAPRRNNYQWFINEEHEVIGIERSELTAKDQDILLAFLTPYHVDLPVPTAEEKRWKERLEGNFSSEPAVPCRLVYFSIPKNQSSPHVLKEAIDAFFGRPVPILWENETEGFIIEEAAGLTEENISYEQIIDVLMSDLYVRISFFVGPFLQDYGKLSKHYTAMAKGASTAFYYADQPVVNYTDAIFYFLIEQTDVDFRDEICSLILQDFTEDAELLETLKTFIACNLNVSVAAKELYMHRNSLQYRLDKFMEHTGIDVRQFHQAAVVYLALLASLHKAN
ncbi:PucR family transcriptional regulator [Lentibacillus sediminis]|uniref:PucR family transcriptional regulator n=1 Tax=Lentibacillus sediminis TaxID=1940529 RepID=UPI000C1C6582|nr:helix-turn-helix domain-containing protein [Lentibacillus sediminis]